MSEPGTDNPGGVTVLAPYATIVLADDDVAHLELLRRTIRRAGFKHVVVTLSGGGDVLDYVLRRGRWDGEVPIGATLMVLDVNMPGGPDGLEVLARIKADHATQHVVVVLHSAADDPAVAERGRELGCADFLAKPADRGAIVRTLEHALATLS